MFVGHLAAAFAAKPVARPVSLGWMVAAVCLPDLLWPVFLLTGWEQVTIAPGATAFTPLVFDSYPWSHSLLTNIVWGLALAALGRWRGISTNASWLLAGLVLSHWVLDFITHAPDMPLWPWASSSRLGLTLWDSIPATLGIEGVLWIAAIWIYLRSRRATKWIGPVAFWSLVLVSTLMWATSPWSPVPPDSRSLAWGSLIGWIVVPWATLADKYYTER